MFGPSPVKFPLACPVIGPGIMAYDKAPVPPEAVTVRVPLLAPLQLILVCVVPVMVMGLGFVMVMGAVVAGVHALASLTVTVYVPAINPENKPVRFGIFPGLRV